MKSRTLLLFAALFAAGGCGSEQGADARQSGATTANARVSPRGTVSPEQARAARLLSLSGGGGAERKTGYAGALECSSSLSLLVQTVESSPLIEQAQSDALHRALEIFRDRARSEGLSEGRSLQEIETDVTRAADNAADDPARSSRSAIACIRQLAGNAG